MNSPQQGYSNKKSFSLDLSLLNQIYKFNSFIRYHYWLKLLVLIQVASTLIHGIMDMGSIAMRIWNVGVKMAQQDPEVNGH